MELFTVPHILEWIATTVVVTAFLYLSSFKLLSGLQQTGYSVKRMFGWLGRRDNLVISSLELLTFMLLLASAVFAVCFSFVGDSAAISLAAYPIFCIAYYLSDRKYALKVKTVRTARYLRLCGAYAFVLTVSVAIGTVGYYAIAFYIGHPLVSCLRYVLLSLYAIALPVILSVANFLDRLYEVPRNKRYARKAERALAEAKLIKIGVTGSYGKTTVKNMLCSVLSEKYRVLVTPASYNTPLGIARCVNRNDLSAYDVFIAEMGARHTGDIAELCDMVKPDYSVITGICPQHLQSFGSVQAIVEAKGEILYGTTKGAVLGEDEYTLTLYDTSPVETLIAGHEVRVSDVRATANGTEFVLWVEDESRTVRTRLLGAHTAQNMCVAATLAYFLDFTIDEIVRGLEKVDFVPHRLQPIYSGGVTILDDSYNANVNGAAAAVETLKLFSGRHFVVTPGLVELGILEQKENEKLGGRLAGLDRVILVGDTLVKSVKMGYDEAGGKGEALTIVPTLDDAQALLAQEVSPGDTVLFLNDLPDIYNV